MPVFAVLRKRGELWQHSLPLESQPEWDAHASFMDNLTAEGFAVMVGPLQDNGDALIIVRAGSASEIENRLAVDPWTRSGLLRTIRIAEWTLRIGALP